MEKHIFESTPENLKCKYSIMLETDVNANGILKFLLSNLICTTKLHQTYRFERIEKRNSHVIKVISERSLETLESL